MMTDEQVAPEASVKEGDLLAGKYRILRVLGTGGMGTVVAAHHIHLDEKVAVKVLHPEIVGNRDVVARFAREARAAAKIKSEHVARVIDVGALESGAPFMVIEYLDGDDLENVLSKRGALQVEEAVEYVLQACEAIVEAHVLGIIHRDLKPANLFCSRRADGTVAIKVLDFGISKVSGPAFAGHDMTMTKTATVMGSPLYMSPEQLESSRDVDVRADIWSLGVILYQLLAGAVPFSGSSFSDLCVKIVTSPLPPLQGSRCQVPPSFERVIAKCMEKNRANRYANVAELALGLAPFASDRARLSVDRIVGVLRQARLSNGDLAEASALGTSAPPESGADTVNPWGRTKPAMAPSRKRALWAGLAGLALFVLLAAVTMHWSTTKGEGGVGFQVAATSPAERATMVPLQHSGSASEPEVTGPQTTVPATSANAAIAATALPASNPLVSGVAPRRNLQAKQEVERTTPEQDQSGTQPQRVLAAPAGPAATGSATSVAVQPVKRSVYEDRK